MDAIEVTTMLLAQPRRALTGISLPDVSGVYAWWFAGASKGGGTLQFQEACPLYVGLARNLAAREMKQHLSDTGTSSSTLRRSLGALFKDEWQLVVYPRGRGAARRDFSHYRFDEAGEKRLTQWMRENLSVSILPLDHPGRYEGYLIRALSPRLNLTGYQNPYGALIRAARRSCAEEARARGREE
ncbi:GIY-YIG nuclease family protein [Thauera propionica]|uniref:GIY-YIG nuclease family protein n=1 Tax=Thauera propionica TaxID=2019431 RepID=UPI001054E62F|nr:hypothetical protein [Thauera propionica]